LDLRLVELVAENAGLDESKQFKEVSHSVCIQPVADLRDHSSILSFFGNLLKRVRPEPTQLHIRYSDSNGKQKIRRIENDDLQAIRADTERLAGLWMTKTSRITGFRNPLPACGPVVNREVIDKLYNLMHHEIQDLSEAENDDQAAS
jgi:hypothetical protein